MGMDFLDIVLRLEKRFRIKLARRDTRRFFDSLEGHEITAGDLANFVRQMLPPIPQSSTVGEGHDQHCYVCGYHLRGLPEDHRCPECGSPSSRDENIWYGVRQVLAEALDLEPEQVHWDSRLIKDLGAS